MLIDFVVADEWRIFLSAVDLLTIVDIRRTVETRETCIGFNCLSSYQRIA